MGNSEGSCLPPLKKESRFDSLPLRDDAYNSNQIGITEDEFAGTNSINITSRIGKLEQVLITLDRRTEYLSEKLGAQRAELTMLYKKVGATAQVKTKWKLYQMTTAQLQGLWQIIANLATLKMKLEQASTMATVQQAFEASSQFMKNITEHLNVETVDETLEDIRGGMENLNDVEELMSENIGAPIDDADLERELAALITDTSVGIGSRKDALPDMPNVPKMVGSSDTKMISKVPGLENAL